MPIINPLIMSMLQDPTSAALQGSEVVKKNVNSHKNPVLALKWIPSTIEIDRKFNLATNTCKKVVNLLIFNEFYLSKKFYLKFFI